MMLEALGRVPQGCAVAKPGPAAPVTVRLMTAAVALRGDPTPSGDVDLPGAARCPWPGVAELVVERLRISRVGESGWGQRHKHVNRAGVRLRVGGRVTGVTDSVAVRVELSGTPRDRTVVGEVVHAIVVVIRVAGIPQPVADRTDPVIEVGIRLIPVGNRRAVVVDIVDVVVVVIGIAGVALIVIIEVALVRIRVEWAVVGTVEIAVVVIVGIADVASVVVTMPLAWSGFGSPAQLSIESGTPSESPSSASS